VSKQIELGIEKMNHGHWLKVSVPYTTHQSMTARFMNHSGELLRTVKLATGNNLIDLEAISVQALHIKIETPYETISRDLNLE
jgi:hypothetical protein